VPEDLQSIPALTAFQQIVSEDYFQALQIPLIKGRFFNEGDIIEKPQVVIVNQRFAQTFFTDENPIGKRICLGKPANSPWREIVGVVADTKKVDLKDSDATKFMADAPTAFIPFMQEPQRVMTLVVRAPLSSKDFRLIAQDCLDRTDSKQPATSLTSLSQIISDKLASEQFNAFLMSVFAIAALLLTSVGIFGVTAYSVTQQTKEIGIRMALGAQAGNILWMVITQGVKLAAGGVALGLVGAFVAARLIQNLLFGVTPTDPATFVAIPLLLVGVMLTACWIPARRATKVDPMIALRRE
jgi:putative ABC transport system permease protein